MGHFFYILGLLLFLANVNFLVNFFDYVKIKEWIDSFKKVASREPTEKDYDKKKFEKFKKFYTLERGNFVWCFFGLITASWKIFLILLGIGLILDLIINLIGEFKLISKLLTISKMSLFSLSILILAINHFHLHKDLFRILLGLL